MLSGGVGFHLCSHVDNIEMEIYTYTIGMRSFASLMIMIYQTISHLKSMLHHNLI